MTFLPISLELPTYNRFIYDCRERNIEYSSSRTFFSKIFSRSKPDYYSYLLCIYEITPFGAITSFRKVNFNCPV